VRLIADPALTLQSWHPSGRLIAANRLDDRQRDVVLISLDGDSRTGWRLGRETSLLSSRASESEPAFSPDGRWIAYQSDESGRLEVYVRPYPGPGPRWPISTDGGMLPTWSTDGRALLYRTAEQTLMAAGYTATADSFRLSPPAPWSAVTLATTGTGQRNFDPHPDGRRVLALINAQPSNTRLYRLLFTSHFGDDVRRALFTQR
jgi:Tol biopolymer transport system component